MAAASDDAIATIGWLHRRFGLGEHIDTVTALAAEGSDPIDAVFADDLIGANDPWGGREYSADDGDRAQAVRDWVGHLVGSDTPVGDRRTFGIHGWLVSSVRMVPAPLMVEQIRLFARTGAGSFPDLLKAVTIDPAMLVYLDGRSSEASAPNENYARELLELFALGTGTSGAERPYSEADVAAAAAALTGWTVRRDLPGARFVPGRHDDTPRRLLGVDGVHDVETVINAIVDHPEHDRFVADRIARDYVGAHTTAEGENTAPDPDVIDELAVAYADGNRRLDAVIRAAAQIVVDGSPTGRALPIVSAPIPWLVGAARTLSVRVDRLAFGERRPIQAMGQLPLAPPSVGGWPGGVGWLTTDTLVARANVAAAIAAATGPDQPAAVAAADRDLDRLAMTLGLLEPFGQTTADALRAAGSTSARLALALISPEYLLT